MTAIGRMTAPSGSERQDELEDELTRAIHSAQDDGLTLDEIDEALAEIQLLVEITKIIAALEVEEAQRKALH